MKLFSFKKIAATLITASMLLSLVACNNTQKPEDVSSTPTSSQETSSEEQKPTTLTDREGKTITIPENMDKIISMAPSVTETLVNLGLADKLVAVDKYSVGIEGIPENLPTYDIMAPDTESIAALTPDIIFATGMSKADGDDPFKPVTDLGVLMTYIPSSSSIEGIKEDIMFVGEVTSTKEKAEEIVANMDKEISDIVAKIGENKCNKNVYFEIGAAPYMYSFGNGVFLNEIIELLGAKNVLVEQEGWVSVSEEWILEKNPDIIFTNVNYVENPTEEIMARNGWDVLNAVKDKQVYVIDTDASSRGNENIVKAIKEIATVLYPDLFK